MGVKWTWNLGLRANQALIAGVLWVPPVDPNALRHRSGAELAARMQEGVKGLLGLYAGSHASDLHLLSLAPRGGIAARKSLD